MKPETRHFKLNVPADLLETLKQIAARESRSVTAQVNLDAAKAGRGRGIDQDTAALNPRERIEQ